MRKTVLSVFMVIAMIMNLYPVCFAYGSSEDDLISVIRQSDIKTRDAFIELLEEMGKTNSLTAVSDDYNELSFSITIVDNTWIELTTVYEVADNNRLSKSGKATHEVLNSGGYLIYTITARGTFTYGTDYCTVTKKSGQFERAPGSFWTSTPSVTQGYVSATKAYVKVSGTASCSGLTSRTYDLRLYCTSSGTLSSTFSGT